MAGRSGWLHGWGRGLQKQKCCGTTEKGSLITRTGVWDPTTGALLANQNNLNNGANEYSY